MEKMLEDSILEDVCVIRMEGFESSFIKTHGKIPEVETTLKSEEDLTNMVKQYIKEEEKQQQILEKIDTHVFNLFRETQFWNKQYYKKAFIDGISFTKEIKYESNKILDIKEKSETFFEECSEELLNFIEHKRFELIKQNKEYRQLNQKILAIKQEYPKIREYLEDEEITELTKDELQALLDTIKLTNDINVIELEEMFKRGIKEGKVL